MEEILFSPKFRLCSSFYGNLEHLYRDKQQRVKLFSLVSTISSFLSLIHVQVFYV